MAQAEDRIYPSDNELEIPNLLLEWQPRNGLLLPFAGWGVTPRAKRGIATYHFYVEVTTGSPTSGNARSDWCRAVVRKR